MTKRTRDDLIDDALRARRAPLDEAGTTAACLDAETCAAWLDRRLDSRERAAAEEHAAGCIRCQAMLSAAVRASDAQPARSVEPARRRFWQMLPWLGPLTAATATAVVWLAVRPAPDPPRRSVEAPAAQSKATVSKQDTPRVSPPEAAPRETPAQPERQKTTASESSKLRRDQRVESKTANSGARQNAGAAANLRDEVRRDVAMPPAGPPTDARAVGAMPPPSPPAAPPPSAARAPGAPAAAPTSAAAKPAEESQLARFAAERAEQTADTALGAVIATPDPNVQWRVLAGTSVQRSIDRGHTWAAQDTGATGALLAGAAPSAAVCWIVGARGAVFLTTDGRTWTRVPFPHEIDLIRVAAESASNATVTSADGRTFRTTDGGRNWEERK